MAPAFSAPRHACTSRPHFQVHSSSTPSHGPHSRGPPHASAFQHVITCRVFAPGAQWRPVISPLYCSVLPWRPIHPGQLQPTTLPLRRLAPNSCSLGLSPTLSLSFSPALSLAPHPLSLSSPFLFHCVPLSLSLSLSLSVSLSHKRGFQGVWCITVPPGVRIILRRTEEVRLIHWAMTTACHPLSCISPLAWGCAQ